MKDLLVTLGFVMLAAWIVLGPIMGDDESMKSGGKDVADKLVDDISAYTAPFISPYINF